MNKEHTQPYNHEGSNIKEATGIDTSDLGGRQVKATLATSQPENPLATTTSRLMEEYEKEFSKREIAYIAIRLLESGSDRMSTKKESSDLPPIKHDAKDIPEATGVDVDSFSGRFSKMLSSIHGDAESTRCSTTELIEALEGEFGFRELAIIAAKGLEAKFGR